MKRAGLVIRILLPILTAALAFGLGWRALTLMPVDYDEDDYTRAGQIYADGFRVGDWSVAIRENYREEHPPLAKLFYGAVFSTLDPIPAIPERPTSASPDNNLNRDYLQAGRLSSVILNVLQILLLGLANPLAALLLAVSTWQLKYTSQVMLEALPALTSTLVALSYLKSRGKIRGWLVASAVFLGLTAASKYLYCTVGIAVLVHWLYSTFPSGKLQGKAILRWLLPPLIYALIALAVFFAANPFLWPDPINRLRDSLLFHSTYAQSSEVEATGFPFYQPLAYLMQSVPWHPGVFKINLELVVFLLALAGIKSTALRKPFILLWFFISLGFLLIWPTKWPQYLLILLAPLAWMAGEGIKTTIWQPLVTWLCGVWSSRSQPRKHLQLPAPALRKPAKAIAWLLPGLIALSLIVAFPMLFQLAMSLTDFQASSIRDGLTGGVFREVWRGLTGQVDALSLESIWDGFPTAKQVHFIGLSYLTGVFNNTTEVLIFEIIWTGLAVVLQLAGGLALALILNQRGIRLKRFWQALLIIPWAIPEFVGALTWSQVFDSRFGWVALAGQQWSQQAPALVHFTATWQENLGFSLLVLLTAATWFGMPFMFLAATAGLKQLPEEVYDAAAMDGAGRWQTFINITWPMLQPLLLPAIIVRVIFTFNQFYLFLTLNPPFPAYTSATLSYIFFNSWGGSRYSFSAAINIVTVLILVVMVLWFIRKSRAGEGVTYA
ncbi:MAG: sugar ABC transporter permease [Anaerolineaceae bacterium]|nr:sugar ABC transporter permease [Anaerolineaceae bacterium]